MQFPSGQLCLFNFIIPNRYGQLTATSLILVLFLVLNFTLCFYFKLLYFILFWCILILVAAVALQIMRFISSFQGASARACGSVGTCQSLTGAFFGIRANFGRRFFDVK